MAVRVSFSSIGPDVDTQRNIAKAFWSLLLQEPDDLSDFEEKVYHDGAGIWMRFACRNGEPCYEESEDEA
jgi:hypothetical protein